MNNQEQSKKGEFSSWITYPLGIIVIGSILGIIKNVLYIQLSEMFYLGAFAPITLIVCQILGIVSIAIIFNRKKIGFWLLILSYALAVYPNYIIGNNLILPVTSFFFASCLMFGLFQIKRNGIKGWNLLK